MGKHNWKSYAAALTLAGALGWAAPAGAQTFNVLHTFSGGSDGSQPLAGLTIDRAGNLYGTAEYGGTGNGTAFELKHSRSGYTFDVLYTFNAGTDGATPAARLMPGPDGRLYGTTLAGGGGGGTVFDIRGSAKSDPRKEKDIYRFANGANGAQPSNGDLAFDSAGNIYGTTSAGGAYNMGVVFELVRGHGKWQEIVLHSFGAVGDGSVPIAGVIRDSAGNLYGTTSAGGTANDGTVFQLVPSGSVYTENVLWNFQGQNDGLVPYAGLTFDAYGDLFGAATDGGVNGGGTIFELTPVSGTWHFNTVYSVPGWGISGSFRTIYVDANGTIYGTTHCDGEYSAGSVFALTRSGSTWNYTSLHDFTGGSDGEYVFAGPVFDSHGNVFGTTQIGGSGNGVVWEISP
jgi:uncharacterized repeat protein (TIGR03803 family)